MVSFDLISEKTQVLDSNILGTWENFEDLGEFLRIRDLDEIRVQLN